MGREQIALGQLHWSTANYQPLQERALWDGLAAMYDQVLPSLTSGLPVPRVLLCGLQSQSALDWAACCA